MGTDRGLRVWYDGAAFFSHGRSGITRYLTELITAYDGDRSLGVVPVLPYRYVANAHLADALPGRFRQVPLPGRARARVLPRLNRGRGRVPDHDVLHHSLYEPALLDMAASSRVSTVYDFSFELFPQYFGDTRSLLADKERFLRESDVLICISETTRADLARVHPDLDKPVFVTPLAAGAGFHDPSPAPLRLPERYVLHVGNRHPHKNADTLFQAFAAIAADVPDVHLVLCGAHLPEEPARLRELGIAGRTTVLRVGDEALPWLYHRAEVFAFPSRYEGFGLPLVEAMAAGCPVISSDAPALVEVAGDVAEYFGPDDVDALAAGLLRLLGDDSLRQGMRDQGRLRARDFSWQRTAAATARAYDQAVQP